MAPRKTYQRQLLSSNYAPSVSAEAGIYEQQMQGSSSMAKMLSTMSGFFYDQMAERVVEEGEMYGAANPITIEELQKAQETGEDPTDRLGYGLKGKAARGVALKILQNEIEIEATKEFNNYMSEAVTQQLPSEEIDDGLDAITLEYTKLLKQTDPKTAYNTKAKLSVISNDLYSDYLKDEIKKETSKNALKEMINLEQDIKNLTPFINKIISENNPTLIGPTIKNYRDKVENIILNTDIKDTQKIKFINTANANIDDAILTSLIKNSKTKNQSLSNLIKEVEASEDITKNGNVVYKTKDSELSSLFNSLSTDSKNDLANVLKKKLDEQNKGIALTSNQYKEIQDLGIQTIKQQLDNFFYTTYQDGDTIPNDIFDKINKLKRLNTDEGKIYSQLATDIQSEFAIETNTTLVSSIENNLKNSLDGMEMNELFKIRNRLTREDFYRFKEIIATAQNAEVKRFIDTVTSNQNYAEDVPEFQEDLSNILVYTDQTKTLKKKQDFIRKQLGLAAERASVKGESFDAFKVYQEIKEKNKDFFKDPNKVLNKANEITNEVFDDLTKNSAVLAKTGLLDKVGPDEFQDNIKFYEILVEALDNRNTKIAREFRNQYKKTTNDGQTRFNNLNSQVRKRLKQLRQQ
mgnify:CR=1 FL=1